MATQVTRDLNFKFVSWKIKPENHDNIIHEVCTKFTRIHFIILFAKSVNILVCIIKLSSWKSKLNILRDAGVLKWIFAQLDRNYSQYNYNMI